MLKLLSSLVVLAGMVNLNPPPPELRRDDLMTELRKGGYTIVLRHARTDRTIPVKETPGYIPQSRADQRNLTDVGVRDAKLMGVVLSKYRVPIGDVISSPMFRTVETAELAARKKAKTTMALRAFPSTPEQAALIAAPVKPGANRLLVTHHFVIETQVPGIAPGEIGESEAVVIRSSGAGAVEIVGRITLSDWEALSGSQATAGNAAVPTRVTRYEPASSIPTAGNATVIPDTPAGKLAAGYIDAFNTGEAARMREFIESRMVANPARSTPERLEQYLQLFEAHGAMTLVNVVTSSPNDLTLSMKSKFGDFRLIMKASEDQRGRLASVSFAVPDGRGHR